MKIKLDENLPVSLTLILSSLQHDVHTVAEENLSGSSDREVWEAAQRDARFLITQDLDFSDLRRFAPGTHCGILLVDSVRRIAGASSGGFGRYSSRRKLVAGLSVS
ncbi:MAG: DUF5615 family PIN-like protein [Candidatus Sulfotelmatobacter sp.]